jgi:Uma2 family endonuclease
MRPAATPSAKCTYDDFLNFPNDGKRHEIIDGEHYVTPSPNTKHQQIVGNLHAAFRSHLKSQPLGAIFVAPFDVVFSDLDVVEPDLLYVSRERRDVLTEAHVKGSPDLVVEVLSPGTRKTDEVTKRKLYERFDVQEYRVIDPELETIKIYRRSGHAFTRAAHLRPDFAKASSRSRRSTSISHRGDGFLEHEHELRTSAVAAS